MPIDNLNSIDINSVNAERNEVCLTITDHLPWDAPGKDDMFQQKFLSYFGYLLSGQLIGDHPEYIGMRTRIEITCMHPPHSGVIHMFNALEAELEKHPIAFSWRTSSFPVLLD